MVMKQCVYCRAAVGTAERDRIKLGNPDSGFSHGVLALRDRLGRPIHIWSHYSCSKKVMHKISMDLICECGHNKDAHLLGTCTSAYRSGFKKGKCMCSSGFYSFADLKDYAETVMQEGGRKV